ncbi:sigma-70 family RNA polymerase sigma factor [Janibacter cremeus]|uniref:sigma-70 family RNA polymerase sigma factor n=1 Tax=Janibacter cremeus TaxID=1285192 RepID=UPI0023FA145A|nr:sigma-70 family RNA polymerase sigma factor [Janibacter cremeus]WEV78741.1 sigma-70 family RNA polymerase sigma factor [Janibacter cremeus]
MTDMATRPATQPTTVTPLPSSIDIDEEVSTLEAHLARLHVLRDTPATEDTEPWTLDHAVDDWDDSPAVGTNAFSRRVNRIRLLTAEDEVTLARRIEAGVFARERLNSGIELKRTERRGMWHVIREGEEAREAMTVANIRLVNKIARQFLPRATTSMDFEDMRQAGLLGLMRAVDKFDHTLGLKFSTYATWWIKQSIGRAVDDESRTVRIPVHMADKCRMLDTARRRAELTWGEAVADPTRLGADADVTSVERARDLLRPCLSLEEVSDELDIVDDEDPALDLVVERAADAKTWADLSEHLAMLAGLGSRAVTILEMRFGLTGQEPMTLDQIGQHFGVTRERIRQIEKKSLEALRNVALAP